MSISHYDEHGARTSNHTHCCIELAAPRITPCEKMDIEENGPFHNVCSSAKQIPLGMYIWVGNWGIIRKRSDQVLYMWHKMADT